MSSLILIPKEPSPEYAIQGLSGAATLAPIITGKE